MKPRLTCGSMMGRQMYEEGEKQLIKFCQSFAREEAEHLVLSIGFRLQAGVLIQELKTTAILKIMLVCPVNMF